MGYLRQIWRCVKYWSRHGEDPIDYQMLERITALVNARSQPNVNALWMATRNLDILALNVKVLGYALARDLARALPPATGTVAHKVTLGTKLSTQSDMEADWLTHWCSQLGIPVLYHRKLWEFAYILQVLYNHDMLVDGTRGLGFGCGVEPLASYFAGRGVVVTMTDLAVEDERSADWSGSRQHASSLDDAHHPALVSREAFERLVSYRTVDMNAIPDDLTGYDFCWSTCALEHLGSIDLGLAFIENMLNTLRPGGVGVHTTEFNVNPIGPTIDNWPTVLFQRRHFEKLAERLARDGHTVAQFDFDPGSKPLDQFVDVPPWNEGTLATFAAPLGQPGHLKVAIDGFVTTCIGIAVTKAR